MNKSLLAKEKMKYLPDVFSIFFEVIQENSQALDALLARMKSIRHEHVALLLKNFEEKKSNEKVSTQEASAFLQGLLASIQQKQKTTFDFLEQWVWKETFENLGKQALEKSIPQVALSNTLLEKAMQEKEAWGAEKAKLQKTIENLTQECKFLRQQKEALEKTAIKLKADSQAFQEYSKEREDYQSIISKIRKELEAKKNLDVWRFKVLYNRIAALTRSEWSYPEVPKPELFLPFSQEVQNFLDSLSQE